MNCLHFSPLFWKELGSPSRASDPNQRPGVGQRPHCASRCVDTFRGYVCSWRGLGWQHVHTHTHRRENYFKPLLSRLEKVSCCKATSAASPGFESVVRAGRMGQSEQRGRGPRPTSRGPGSCWRSLPPARSCTRHLCLLSSCTDGPVPQPGNGTWDDLVLLFQSQSSSNIRPFLIANPESRGPEWRPGPDTDKKA